MDKKYQNEIEKLPAGHHLGVEHECFNYPTYQDYLETKSDYHFDKYKNDDDHPDINTNLKFRWKSDITKEIFPYIRENSRNVHPNSITLLHEAWWLHENEIRGLDHIGFKEMVKPKKHPTLEKIVNWFEFSGEISPQVMQQNVGNFSYRHLDEMCGHQSGHGIKKLIRVIINLQDWEPGQFMLWGNKNIHQWKAGDCVTYDPNIPHATANASRYRRYALRITGLPSDKTMQKIRKGGIISL